MKEVDSTYLHDLWPVLSQMQSSQTLAVTSGQPDFKGATAEILQNRILLIQGC
jgi:hypothetical protein